VKRTHEGGDVGIVRIMFPNRPQSEDEGLVEISWDEEGYVPSLPIMLRLS
jgi:hypothetical protein